ncbi:uncharacterized protein YlzI (FlbEa/FlbD family) [Pedobacter sp. UYEF25]
MIEAKIKKRPSKRIAIKTDAPDVPKKTRVQKGTPPKELDKIKFDLFDFTGEWFEAFSKPERNGMWFIWGNSGNGKTTFVLKMVKYLANFEKVIYNSLEEGVRKTMQDAFRKVGMNEVNGKVLLVKESIDDLIIRLKKRRSAKIAVIDSTQYSGLNFKAWLKLKAMFPEVLFILVSQADGKKPKGRPADDIHYDADLKIWVEGHRAISKGRYIGTKGYYTNWIEGAIKYYEH